MSKHRQYSTVGLTESLQPMLSGQDNLDAASKVLNDVLEHTAALSDHLRAIANRHVDTAPASSAHVVNLSGAIARTVLDWIGQWPS